MRRGWSWALARPAPGAGSGLGGEAGAAAIEFALVAPLLFLLFIGIFEFSMILFVSGTLESAVLGAARFGITGASGQGVTREARIREILAERTMGFVDMSRVVVTTKVYPHFADIGRPEPWNDRNNNGVVDAGEYTDVNGNGHRDEDMGKSGLGGAGDVVLYKVEYTTVAMTVLLAPIIGTFRHLATVAVRNEPE